MTHNTQDLKRQADEVNELLSISFPEPQPPLYHTQAHELLFAVLLSAQSTDVGVNKVTPILFSKYKTVADFAAANVEDIKLIINKVNFHNNKAKNIVAAAQVLMKNFAGKVPETMEELITLPGIARKSANVVLAQWFHKYEGIAVDTHVIRVSNRLGLTDQTKPVKIEQELMPLFPQNEWGKVSLRLIYHGRQICTARTPKCSECILNKVCPTAFKVPGWR